MQISKVNQNSNTNPAFKAVVLKNFQKIDRSDYAILEAIYESPIMRARFDIDFAAGNDTILKLTRRSSTSKSLRAEFPETPYDGRTILTVHSNNQPDIEAFGSARSYTRDDALWKSGENLAKNIKELKWGEYAIFSTIKNWLNIKYGVKNK